MKIRFLIAIALWASACVTPTSPAGAAIDTLDYVIGDPSMWPRIGNQWQQQTLDQARQEVCWIKYANPRRFECWRWNDDWIFHRVDHAIDGDSAESYEFTDGRWLPRHLSTAWSLDVPGNAIRWFDRDCRVNPQKSRPAPYRLAVTFEPLQNVGGDLGFRDVMVLEYAPDPDHSSGYAEHFYFARGAGWYAWDNGRVTVRFDRFSGGELRQRAAGCGE